MLPLKGKVAVLDLTHAGMVIAQKLAVSGMSVTAVDVYDTVDKETLSLLENDFGITVSKKAVPVDDLDLIVSPVHLDPDYRMLRDARGQDKKIISHHHAVGMILSHNRSLDNVRVIEVTGSRAKTSTASLLAEILSRSMAVALHTSRGLEIWKDGEAERIYAGLSIAPGSILLAVDILISGGIDVDCCIFEVSIGGTGYADIGLITTLEPDYAIANSSSMASDVKLSMVESSKGNSVLFLNAVDRKAVDIAQSISRDFFTFSDSEGIEADLMMVLDGKGIRFSTRDLVFAAYPDPFYNASSYTTAFAAASAVALHMGIGADTVTDVINGFKGLAGRMQEKRVDGRILIDNSNSGMDIRSAERSLDHGLARIAGRTSSRVFMVLGEEAAQVCEGLPPEGVEDFVGRRIGDIDTLILVGERMRSVMSEGVLYAPHLAGGLEEAFRLSSEDDLILSCVKCFR
ncbi:MAG: coenzyme F430 synthase [Methanosarcinaceae archaeon]|nr:coenzyme F430 synthase [Methanosarcinaceae archaeon]